LHLLERAAAKPQQAASTERILPNLPHADGDRTKSIYERILEASLVGGEIKQT